MTALLVLTGRSVGIRYPLDQEETLIGRSSSSDVQLVDDAVSRKHAIVRRSASGFEIEDLESQNGVRKNGLRVNGKAPLEPGDTISIGETTFVFDPPIELIGGPSEAKLAIVTEGHESVVDREVKGDERGADDLARSLLELSARFSEGDPRELVDEALSVFVARFRADRGLVVGSPKLLGGAKPKVLASAGKGMITLSRTVVRRVLEEGRAIASGDAPSELACSGGVSLLAGEIRSILAAPLVFGGRTIGMLHLDKKEPAAYGPSDLETLVPSANVLALFVVSALGLDKLKKELRKLERTIEPPWIVAESPAFRSIVNEVRRAAASDSTVLLEGETGTGKEVLARLLHSESDRSSGPFVAVNLGALPPGLEESELFGHEKGAFTGAAAKKEGLFEAASGGTLFLDELGEAPPQLQVKLLRAIQERAIHHLGGTHPIEIDVRLVAATSRRLEDLVQSGKLRSDLYHRLAVIHLRVPPLRARKEDLAPLARGLLERTCKAAGISKELSPEVLDLLGERRWSGNVRELRNVIERLAIMTEGPTITLGDLPPDLLAGSDLADRAIASAESLESAVAKLEREMILRAMTRTGGVKSAAAHALGISRVTLDAKIKAHAIEWKKS
jgi:DNA-binding NtrC family response regulator